MLSPKQHLFMLMWIHMSPNISEQDYLENTGDTQILHLDCLLPGWPGSFIWIFKIISFKLNTTHLLEGHNVRSSSSKSTTNVFVTKFIYNNCTDPSTSSLRF